MYSTRKTPDETASRNATRRRASSLAFALAAAAGLAGCQTAPPAEPEPVSGAPMVVDEAMQIRGDWPRSVAEFQNGATEAGATRFPYVPQTSGEGAGMATLGPERSNAALDTAFFVGQTLALPFTYIVDPPFTPKTYRGVFYEPTYTAMPVLPPEEAPPEGGTALPLEPEPEPGSELVPEPQLVPEPEMVDPAATEPEPSITPTEPPPVEAPVDPEAPVVTPEVTEPAPVEPTPEVQPEPEPAPQATEPAAPEQEPVAPAPEATEPMPEATEPAPEVTEPAPETTEPVPAEPAPSEPVPAEPAPEKTEPAPDASEPVPEPVEPAESGTEENK